MVRKTVWCLVVAASLAVLLLCAGAGWAEQQRPWPQIVRVKVDEGGGVRGWGSGTLVWVGGQKAVAVTNNHVVRGNRGGVTIYFPGGFESRGNVVKRSSMWDLAAVIVNRPPGIEPLRIARTNPVVGEQLWVAGYGSGSYRVASGRVTQYVMPDRDNEPALLLEVAVPVRDGDSGGPIINKDGELVGTLFGTDGSTYGSASTVLRWFLKPVVARLGGTLDPMPTAKQPRSRPDKSPKTEEQPTTRTVVLHYPPKGK